MSFDSESIFSVYFFVLRCIFPMKEFQICITEKSLFCFTSETNYFEEEEEEDIPFNGADQTCDARGKLSLLYICLTASDLDNKILIVLYKEK